MGVGGSGRGNVFLLCARARAYRGGVLRQKAVTTKESVGMASARRTTEHVGKHLASAAQRADKARALTRESQAQSTPTTPTGANLKADRGKLGDKVGGSLHVLRRNLKRDPTDAHHRLPSAAIGKANETADAKGV